MSEQARLRLYKLEYRWNSSVARDKPREYRGQQQSMEGIKLEKGWVGRVTIELGNKYSVNSRVT
jgi:hypothetical protein